MIPYLIIGGIGLAAFTVWHHARTANKIPPGWEPYYGAPVWPAMTPQIVPDVGLPTGIEAAVTRYGVSSSLLEPYTK